MSKVDPLQNTDPVSLDGLDQVFSGDKVSALFDSDDDDDDDLDEVSTFESDLSLMQEIAALQSELGSIQEETMQIQSRRYEESPSEDVEGLPVDIFSRGESVEAAVTKDLDELARQDLEQLARQNLGSATAAGTMLFNESHSNPNVRPVRSRTSSERAKKLGDNKRPGQIKVEDLTPPSSEEIAAATKQIASASALQDALVGVDDRVSRGDLVNLLEGFVKILRTDEPNGRLNLVRAQQLVNVAPEQIDIRIEDKSAELEEMRRLVIEAQETIIKLLTDRVEDRARIATLEAEVRLLPDLQEQADRAMAVAFKTEEFRSEIHRVKFELERYRLSSARALSDRGPLALISRVRKWFLKGHGMRLRNINMDSSKQISQD